MRSFERFLCGNTDLQWYEHSLLDPWRTCFRTGLFKNENTTAKHRISIKYYSFYLLIKQAHEINIKHSKNSSSICNNSTKRDWNNESSLDKLILGRKYLKISRLVLLSRLVCFRSMGLYRCLYYSDLLFDNFTLRPHDVERFNDDYGLNPAPRKSIGA